jgi:WD40 repeat protein
MYTLEIAIQRSAGHGWPVVVEQTPPGVLLPQRSEGVLRLDRTELLAQATPRAYGTVLGRALFQDGVRDAFVEARSESGDDLRVLLAVETGGGPDDLRTLRWERLCAPFDDSWDFLALDQRIGFSLYLPSLTDRRFPPIGRRDLRALVIAACPSDLERYGFEPFDVAGAVARARGALGEIPCEVLSSVGGAEGVVGPPTLDALCGRLTEGPYTLLHVICHGAYRRDGGESVLYLAADDGTTDPVGAGRLLERLGRVRGPRGLPHFAFLVACESATAEAEGAFGGLAQRLVRDLGMPAVLAMTESVTIETAEALTVAFYRRLQVHGQVDRALGEASAELGDHQDVNVPALFSRLGGRPLFSDALDQALSDATIASGLDRLAVLVEQRAPVLRGRMADQDAALRGRLGAEAGALSPAAREERARALLEVDELCQEVTDLSFSALALGQAPPAYDDRCPFPGLLPFRSGDREFYFGRDALVDELRAALAEDRFLAVVGPSGSGKSSLVLAGLLPILTAGGQRAAYVTPGSEPLARLEAQLGDAGILVVDQLEELFTLCPDEDERRRFLDRLVELAEQRRVIVTMRADFWGECAGRGRFTDRMQARQQLIAPMRPEELARAMEQQARSVGLRFEAGLEATILEDVRGEPGAMPLLQHALLELWRRRHGRWLRGEEYRAIGGVQQAIARTADDLYASLPAADQERVRGIFLRLTRPDEDAVPGEERRDTRRRVAEAELVPAGADPAETRALVRRLADARLVVTGHNRALGRDEVEVAHEALIRHWPRLRTWLNEDRVGLRLWEGIREAAQEWQAHGRAAELLVHRGGRLAEAAGLARERRLSLNALEAEYLDACRAFQEAEERRELEAARERAELAEEASRQAQQRADEQRRAAVRQRYLSVLAGLIALVALGAAVFALGQRQAALSSADEAQRAEATAVAERDRAEGARQEADRQRQVADDQRSEADRQRGEAERQRQEAIRQAGVARSRELAASALAQIPFDPELSLLLALEATSPTSTAQAEDALRQALAASHVRALMQGHTGPVLEARFSADGRSVTTIGADAQIGSWAPGGRGAGGPSFVRLDGYQGRLLGPAFSDDGGVLATLSDGPAIRIWDVRTGRLLHELTGHGGQVLTVAFSPNGRLLASGGSDGTARLWDVATGSQLAALGEPPGNVWTVAFSRDGTRLATAGGAFARLWDVEGRRELKAFSQQGVPAGSLALSPDGRRLATVDDRGLGRVWDAESGEALAELRGHTSHVFSVIFSPDGGLIATASADRTARVWSAATGRPVAELRGHGNAVYGAAFSPSGKRVATVSEDHTARVWDAGDGHAITVLSGHVAPLHRVRFSPDGKQVLTAGQDGTVRLWDPTTSGDPIALRGHTEWVTSGAISPDGKLALTASGRNGMSVNGRSGDATARLWDVATGRQLVILGGHAGPVVNARFSPDGSRIVTASADGTARLWDRTGRLVSVLRGHTPPLWDASFSPDGGLVLTAGQDESARLWQPETGQPVRELPGHAGGVRLALFGPDGRLALTMGNDGKTHLWDVASGQQVGALQIAGGMLPTAAFSPDGRLVVTGDARGTAKVSAVASGAVLAELRGHADEAWDVDFSPDGRRVVTASRDKTARVWEAETGRPVTVLEGHTGPVTSARFSPDGQLIVTASTDDVKIDGDRTARIWDAESGRLVAVLEGHTGGINAAVFGPDGSTVLTVSDDTTGRIYPCEQCAPLDRLIALARAHLTRELTPYERERLVPPAPGQ